LQKRLQHLLSDNPHLFFGGVFVALLFVGCLLGALIPYDPVLARMKGEVPNLAPSWRYWLGTDTSGQSLLMLLIEGTEAFFFPGILATCIALFGGIALGSFSGFYGGWIEQIGRYLSTLINSFPSLILVLLCTTVFGPHMSLVAAVVGLTFIPHIGEEIRRKVAQLKAEEFVMAAEAHGLRERRILFLHIVWLHCLPLILRQLVFLWSALIILETSLNYLGQGVLQKGISWGKLLYEYRDGLFRGQLWSPLVVTLAVMMTMAGLYLFAEGLQRWSQGKGILYQVAEDEQPTNSAEVAP
jgi:peptide/nickel transport system permease protein